MLGEFASLSRPYAKLEGRTGKREAGEGRREKG
jgi:hypothetical protein